MVRVIAKQVAVPNSHGKENAAAKIGRRNEEFLGEAECSGVE